VGKLADISGKEAVKAFQKAGWAVRGQVGSHVVMTKTGVRANLTVPQHSELAPGTLRSLIRTAGLSVDEFLNLL
jgi:predicted RNA binding protein YcfA (HicA-like mRNA interferase family)